MIFLMSTKIIVNFLYIISNKCKKEKIDTIKTGKMINIDDKC